MASARGLESNTLNLLKRGMSNLCMTPWTYLQSMRETWFVNYQLQTWRWQKFSLKPTDYQTNVTQNLYKFW
jgi:hypothetical protein